MVNKTIEMIRAQIGCSSCVGIINKNFPLSFGNYFNFASGERCLNMWAENLDEFVRRNEILELECTVFSDVLSKIEPIDIGTEGEKIFHPKSARHYLAFVTDKRVPTEWLHKDLCITGCGWGSRELCEACCRFQNASTVNRICGCEANDQAPHIYQSYEYKEGKQIGINVCATCHRQWPMVTE